MPDYRMTLRKECQSCGGPIYWTTTQHGKRMPVDAKPAVDGNLFLFLNQRERASYETGEVTLEPFLRSISAASASEQASTARQSKQSRYTSHFATCPNATSHRRRK